MPSELSVTDVNLWSSKCSFIFPVWLIKRVLFHDQTDFETTGVNDNIQIAFRPIQAAACDPEEFARNYPVGRVLNAPAATRMIPSKIRIDFRKGRWQGEFGFEA